MYLLIFTCFSVRAVYIEIGSGMRVLTILQALLLSPTFIAFQLPSKVTMQRISWEMSGCSRICRCTMNQVLPYYTPPPFWFEGVSERII